jgi:esterase/lipase superfamily enzyme
MKQALQDLTALGATVIDLSDVKADDPTNHAKFAQLAEVAPQLRNVLEHGVAAKPDASRQEAAGSALGSIVALPVTLLGAPVRIIAGQ